MALPIAVEIASSAPVDADLSRVLIDSCSSAAGEGGCVLAADLPGEGRARVIVSFSGGDARVRVEVLAPTAGGAGTSREVSFRDDDPPLERFRAAGLIAAGLVTDLASGETSSGPAPDSPRAALVPARTPPQRRVVLGFGGQSEWNGGRPWVGAALGADVALAGPGFLSVSGSYAQTWERDANGIAGQRTALGLGAGLVAPLVADRLEVRVRLALDIQELRASIRQPVTLREDDAGRTSSGVGAGVDLALPITAGLGVFCGGRVDWWGGETTVRVQGTPEEILGAWAVSVALGLNVRVE
jgi:hypothetical protein